MEMKGIKITKEQFERDYIIINKEGVIKGIKVAGKSNSYFNENIAKVNDNYEKTILVNLKAIEARNVKDVLELFEGRNDIDLAELTKEYEGGRKKSLTYVHQIHLNKDQSAPLLPLKGQEVTLQFYYAEKNGEYVLDTNGKKIFNSSQMQVPEPEQATKFSFAKVEEKVEERVTMTLGEG